MGLITKGMGAILKHIKKPGHAITRAGDKWMAKTKKLQQSKKKIEKIRGNLRIIAPMAVASWAGARTGIKQGEEEIKRRGVYGVERKDVGPKSIYKDIKKVIKKVKGK